MTELAVGEMQILLGMDSRNPMNSNWNQFNQIKDTKQHLQGHDLWAAICRTWLKLKNQVKKDLRGGWCHE